MLNVKMIVRGKNYHIRSDGSQFILTEEVKRMDKKTKRKRVVENTIGYFPRIDGLFNDLLSVALRKEDSKTLQELKFAFDEMCREITAQWRY